ncbi:MAG TPA: hypothetical protein V6D07_18955 [Trichocoleus sp.]
MSQVLGQITFQQQVSTNQARAVALEWGFSQTAPDKVLVTLNGDFSEGNRNVQEITIADPAGASVSAGAYYTATLTDGTTSRTAVYQFQAGQTAANVAALLAEIVDLHPSAQAAVKVGNTSKIVVTGRRAGVQLTLTVDCRAKSNDAQIAGAITSAEITPPTGSSVVRKLAEITTDFNVAYASNTEGKDPTPGVELSVQWFNGSPITPVAASSPSKYPSTSAKTIAQLEAAV